MVKLYDTGVYLVNGRELVPDGPEAGAALRQLTGREVPKEEAVRGTMAYGIIQAHNTSGDPDRLKIKFDSITSHDITYVGIIQTARASGMTRFPIPYVLTNCHNSLCAVGGTINEDDHMFALSAAKKYGGIYVPTNMAVIHSYNREMMTRCGKMILGSDSHTRYGALGTMAVGEGGGELAKQLLGRTYDFARPGVIGIYLTGKPQKGVGPQDVALSIIGKVYANGYVKNRVMEFVGDGVDSLPVEYRNGIDVMTTETTCWSSIWRTDAKVEEYYDIHGRKEDYRELNPAAVAYYDGLVYVDLSKVEPTIAMPFHPSNTYTIAEFKAHPKDVIAAVTEAGRKQFENAKFEFALDQKLRNGEIWVDQGLVAGCSGGTFDNVCAVADILDGHSCGNGSFTMSVYPGSQPAYLELVKNGAIQKIVSAGAIVRECFCGPCFGAGDTPANQEFSIRHTTRNFPNREGSKPGEGQISYVALMDARSIAATAINGGRLTAATEIDASYTTPKYFFDQSIYEKRVFDGWGKADPAAELKFGPNIKDWPEIPALTEDILLKVVSYIDDPVTTTDELIPSGETSSYRSNPLRLAEFALSRKDPAYVGASKEVLAIEQRREAGEDPTLGDAGVAGAFEVIRGLPGFAGIDARAVGIGSTIYANKPGDGSAREQAASCQRVVGAWANIAQEYATKRYRSNCINWGMVPFLTRDKGVFEKGCYVFVPGVRKAIAEGSDGIRAYVIRGGKAEEITLSVGELTPDERKILTAGCLINYYRAGN
ncbi:MAG: hydratase [Angelakisella sp.]|jgi:aconitate hydratase|nr:hydratase [Angelakisella sp.]